MLLKNFVIPETLNKFSHVFGLGMHKHLELEAEVIVFTITLLGSE